MMYWLMGFQQCSKQPTIAPLNQLIFLQALKTVSGWEDIITQESNQANIIIKKSEPGKFKVESKWNNWDAGIINFLYTIHGALGVPLSYVICENVDPIHEGHRKFIEKNIACARLAGPIFKADARRVHQVINSNVQGESAEQWIEPSKKKQNGKIDMLTLRSHYSGEGNSSCCIGEAEILCDRIHYKSERSM